MNYVNGFIALVLVGAAFFARQDPLVAGLFTLCALLAALSTVHLPRFVGNSLAVATTIAMFASFALFFGLAPNLEDDWYMQREAISTFSSLFSAFAMIPVLSEFSCRMKASESCAKGKVITRRVSA